MNNITWSKKSSTTHDNGERNMCWRVGKPPENGNWIVTLKHKDSVCSRAVYYDKEVTLIGEEYGEIIAYMKLPTPYKPD